MTWRQHLRDLVLAGGALAAAACSATPVGGGPPGGPFCCNANSDPCCESNYCGAAVSDACACKQKGGDWQNPAPDGGFACTFPSDAGPPADTGSGCCNANPDPCCPSEYCGQSVSAACMCKQDGGTWDYSATRCDSADAGPAEAGPIEAAPGDGSPGDAAAGSDAHI